MAAPAAARSAIVEYQVPIPPDVSDLRLHFCTGIRDGSHLAEGNVVAFRVFVNEWKIWSDTQHLRMWRTHEVEMPALSGDVARIRFMTDGLGNHEWAWAVWGEPKLVGGELTAIKRAAGRHRLAALPGRTQIKGDWLPWTWN